MEKRRASVKFALILLFLSGMIFSACSGGEQELPPPPGTYEVDPVFLEFYNDMGGADVFGYAITTPYTTEQGKRGQYFESVLMIFDMTTQEITFEPLGVELGLSQTPYAAWDGPAEGGLRVGAFYIPPSFSSLYLDLEPERVGMPLTDPYVNLSKNRVEQHYETLGLYYELDDPEQTVKLLHYGRLHCGSCNYTAFNNPAVVAPTLTDKFFFNQMALSNIDISLTGEVVEGPLMRHDGTSDLIFDFVVLYEHNGVLRIRDLPVLLGLDDEFLYARNDRNGLIFREIKDGLGHNVLYLFDDYIKTHGGYAVSGEPVTELIIQNAETRELRQCFEHYCLDYNPNVISEQVRPTPLGEYYFDEFKDEFYVLKSSAMVGGEEAGARNDGFKERTKVPFTLLAWENHTVVDSQTPQTIFVMVDLQQTPQPGMLIDLTVDYPDGHSETVSLSETNQEGLTGLTLDPIEGDNGDLVRYEACLTYQDLPPICVEQMFMIWGNP